MRGEVLRDLFRFLPAKVVPALVGILSVPVLTHLFPPREYGLYLLAKTSLALILSFCISWLVSVTMRYRLALGEARLWSLSRPLLLAGLLLAAVLWIAISGLTSAEANWAGYLLVGLFWLAAQGSYDYWAGWLRARNAPLSYGMAVSWQSAAGFAAAVLLYWAGGRSELSIFLGQALAMTIGLTFLYRYVAVGRATEGPARVSADGTVDLLKYGVPVAFATVVTTGLSLADRYIVGLQLGPQAVAIYGASYDLAERSVFFVNSMLLLATSVTGFRIFEKEGEGSAATFLTDVTRLYLLVVPPLVVVAAVYSDDIVDLLLPATYASGAPVLPVVAAGGVFVGILHRYSLLLSFHKRTDLILWCGFLALLAEIALCWWLVARFGIMGAALATTAAYALWFLMVRIAAHRFQCPRFPWPTLGRVAVSLTICAFVMHYVAKQVPGPALVRMLTGILAGVLVYGLALVSAREFSVAEIRSILARRSRPVR